MPNTRAGMRSLSALSLVSALLFAGCMSDEDSAMTRPDQSTPTAETGLTFLTLFFLRDGKVSPVLRDVASTPRVAGAALGELLDGPTPEETAAGLETAIPDGTERETTNIKNGVATVDLSPAVTDRAAQAQLVYTLTQFPTVKRVALTGGPARGRAAFEALTPAILVESPLPGEAVEPGFEVAGTANTFEATFNYELRDDAGRVLSKDFVTATSGSGTRGTFAFDVPFELDETTDGTLVVFELSAEDGSRINEVEIPLQLGSS
jgi:germination protein M